MVKKFKTWAKSWKNSGQIPKKLENRQLELSWSGEKVSKNKPWYLLVRPTLSKELQFLRIPDASPRCTTTTTLEWTAEEFPRVEKLHHYFTTANSHVVSTTWHHFHYIVLYYSTLDLSPGGRSHLTHYSGHHKPGTVHDLVRNAGVGGLEHSPFLNELHDFFPFFFFHISRKH